MSERVRSAPRDQKPAPGDHAEQHQHAQAADEAKLFADDREDRVGVRIGHPVELL